MLPYQRIGEQGLAQIFKAGQQNQEVTNIVYILPMYDCYKKGFSDARYNKNLEASAEEVTELISRTEKLLETMANKLCLQKLEDIKIRQIINHNINVMKMEEKHMEQKWLRELYYISIHEMRNPVRALWVLYQQHSPNSIKDRLWNWYTYILCDTLVVDNPIAIMELQKLMESLIELAWLLCQTRPIEASEETYRTLNTGSDMETPHYWPRHRLEAYDFRQPMVFIEGHFFMFFELTDCRKILGKWLGYALSLSAIPEKEMGDSAFFLDFLLRLVDLLHLIKKREIDDFIQYKEQFI